MKKTYPVMTKDEIRKFVKKIQEVLKKKELINDCAFYYNGIRDLFKEDHIWQGSYTIEIKKANPFDYFDYANKKHILSIATEGPLYDKLYRDGSFPNELEALFKKLNLYYEFGDMWNLSFYPIDDEQYDYIEFTDYRTNDEVVMETHSDRNSETNYICYGMIHPVDPCLKRIMDKWFELSKGTGDIGSCVIGAGFEFNYNNKHYKMASCSPYQGSISWETHIEEVKNWLVMIGATDIVYHWGNLD